MPQAYIIRYCGYHTAGISPVRRTDIIEKSISTEMHFSLLRAVRRFGRHPCLPAVLSPQAKQVSLAVASAFASFGIGMPQVPTNAKPHLKMRRGSTCFLLVEMRGATR